MNDINPNNWHYTVDSGLEKGSVVVPLAVTEKQQVLCSVQFSNSEVSKRGDHILLSPEILTRLNECDFAKYQLHASTPIAA